jgi:hypothetical protein
MSTTQTRQYQDAPVDLKLVLCALWVATLFVFAYVDIFGFFRADVLEAARDGEVAYYLLGSLVEAGLLAAIIRAAWRWPPPQP